MECPPPFLSHLASQEIEKEMVEDHRRTQINEAHFMGYMNFVAHMLNLKAR